MSDERGLTIHQASHLMPAMSMAEAAERFNQLATFTKTIMREGIDYGVIPGTEKPTLYKPGAEKLTTFFGLRVQYDVIEKTEDWTGSDHGGEPFFYYWFRCQLWRGDLMIAGADGSCNSWETKYRYRWADRVCPNCEKSTIIKGKEEYGGGWLCWAKRGGCGSKWKDGAPEIEKQELGRIPNPDPADIANTILKMAQKRALVASTLLAVNASEYYTQDLEDLTIEGNFTVSKPDNGDDGSAQATATNGDRPLSPDKLLPGLRKKAGWHKIGDEYKRDVSAEPVTDKKAGVLAGRIEKLFPNLEGGSRTNARYEVLGFLFGLSSAKDLTMPEARALFDWTEDVDAATLEAAQILELVAQNKENAHAVISEAAKQARF